MVIQFQHTIQEEMGLHARPAGLLVKKAKALTSTVTVALGEKSCDAKKLMRLMSLEAQKGNTLVITVDGENAQCEAQELKEYLAEIL